MSDLYACPHVQETEVTFQKGVLRTNCIDCLDRTNVAQFVLGLHALEAQLHALGISDSPSLDIESSMATELMNLYEQMGDTLAKQVPTNAALLSKLLGHTHCLIQAFKSFADSQHCRNITH